MVQQIELLQNQKCQTGDSKSFREKNNKTFSSSKSYQALTYETKSFHVKSTRSSREDFSKNQNSQNGNKFFITQKKTFREEQIKKYFSSLKSHQASTCNAKSLHVSTRRGKHFFVGTSRKHFEHFSKSKLE